MEVASILTSNINLEDLLKEYLMKHELLQFDRFDDDTYYFHNKRGTNEIFYYINNDVEFEFSYNFSERNLSYIKEYFEARPIYLLDISFKHEDFFRKLISGFVRYVIDEHGIAASEILIDDPFKGLLNVDNNGELKPVKLP